MGYWIPVSTYNGLAQKDMGSDHFDYLTTEEGVECHGYIDTMMSNSTMVVADTLNQKLRIVDLHTMIISTWCFIYAGIKAGLQLHDTSTIIDRR